MIIRLKLNPGDTDGSAEEEETQKEHQIRGGRTSLAVQWLGGLGLPTQGVVRSLVGELRSHSKPRGQKNKI